MKAKEKAQSGALKRSDLLRYILWGAVAATAEANRREYHMSTTWFPHFFANSITLLLPDVYRLLFPKSREKHLKNSTALFAEIEKTLGAMIRDNNAYGVYVAPLALGYILSHPKFNIYKGDMGDIKLAGFGLDAVPHSSTALALTALICDTMNKAAEVVSNDQVANAVSELSRYPALVSGVALALATFIWEYGEYQIHQHEMGLRGDITKINMMWSPEDTIHDVVSNFVGWGIALLLRHLNTSSNLDVPSTIQKSVQESEFNPQYEAKIA